MMRLLLFGILFLSFSITAANQQDLEKLAALKTTKTTSMDLSHADLRYYPFTPGKIDLQQANLSHSNLAGVDLSKLNLGGANLSYADLSHAKLNQVNLVKANLSHANLSYAELQKSDLSEADLSYANLIHSDLQQSIFSKANLTCAHLDKANLNQTRFNEAIISGATFIATMTSSQVDYDTVVDSNITCNS
jgi:uncharacterized protein YjbI with pentapeptide repeats